MRPSYLNYFIGNIEQETQSNDNYRKVVFTGKNMQLVYMSLVPGQEIGMEIHNETDQFIRVESGNGQLKLNGKDDTVTLQLLDDTAALIPAGTWHNVINNGSTPLKIYVLYSPPEHEEGLVQPENPNHTASTNADGGADVDVDADVDAGTYSNAVHIHIDGASYRVS